MLSVQPGIKDMALSGGLALAPTVSGVTIVIPAHNEEGAIGSVLSALRGVAHPALREVIVVDDGSSDRTGEIAQASGVRVIRQPSNRGYGAALKAGIRAASSEYVLTMDADGQHRIEDVLKLCDAVSAEGAADCVIGHRTKLVHSPLWRMPGKWFLTHLARVLTRKEIRDLNSGLRVMRREVIVRYMHLCPAGFSFSTTSTFALASRGYRLEFVPIFGMLLVASGLYFASQYVFARKEMR